ncbi:MAG TPA: AI-2E family transporter, partial [Roseiflexaceae bacterium]|nr:AI-2E family transporter [Roseiflexaceae bacterium]
MTTPHPPDTSDHAELQARARAAGRAWRRLALRLRSITPGALARALLVAGALYALGWLIWTTWAILLPFQLGLVLAYLMLPLVNRLGRRMRRELAEVLVFAGGLLALVGGVAAIIPPLLNQIAALIAQIPSVEEARRSLDELDRFVRSLPPETQRAIDERAAELLALLRENFLTYAQGALSVVASGVFSVLNLLGFVLGFLIVPLWLFYVIRDQDAGREALDRALPPWARPDFWAVVRIVDRTFSGYIRGQLVLALVAAALVFAVLTALALAGVAGVQYTVLLAVIAGVTQLVPYVGPFLATIAAGGVGAFTSWEAALWMALAVLVSTQLINTFLAPIVVGRSIHMHEAVLMAVLIMLSQFGFVWIILAAPVAGAARD